MKGPKAGQHEIFVDGLPGMPDNLRRSGNGGFYVPLITPRFRTMPVLSDVIAPYPVVRKFLARLICLLQAPAKLVNKYYPNPYTGGFTYMVMNTKSTDFLVLLKCLVFSASRTNNKLS